MSEESIADRLPVFDGSLRRKFIVGTLVLLSLVFSQPDTPSWIGTIQQNNGLWGSSLLGVIFFLLVYAVGSAVELLGEVSIVRAIAGGLWGAVYFLWKPFPNSWLAPLRRHLFENPYCRYSARLILVGIVRLAQLCIGLLIVAPIFFFLGLLGISFARISINDSLSVDGKTTLNKLPDSIREGLNDPIGKKSELAFEYLIEAYTERTYKKWARNLVARCKDALTLATTILLIVGYFGILSVYPFYTHHDESKARQLNSANQIITAVDYHIGRLVPSIVQAEAELFRTTCGNKEPSSPECRALQFRLAQISDLEAQPTRAMTFWHLPTMQFIERSVTISKLEDLWGVISRLEYGRDTFFHSFATVDLRPNERGKSAAKELISLLNDKVGELQRIQSDYITAENRYDHWYWYTLLALLFSIFMYLGSGIIVRNTMISLIEGLAAQSK